jgi:gas vesicle protein
MNEDQHRQLDVLIEEVRTMRENQYEMMQQIKEFKSSLSTVIATSFDNVSYDVRRSISDAAERIVNAATPVDNTRYLAALPKRKCRG